MFLVMGTVFLFSHQPAGTLHLALFPGEDKVCHLTAYALLALASLWCFGSLDWRSPRKAACLAVVVCLGYAVSDEFHQSFVPGRDVSALDIVADMVGASLVCWVWLGVPKCRRWLENVFMSLAGMMGTIYN